MKLCSLVLVYALLLLPSARCAGLFDDPLMLFADSFGPGLSHSEKGRVEKTWRGFYLRADSQAYYDKLSEPSEYGIYLNVAVRDPEEIPVFKDTSKIEGQIIKRMVEIPAPTPDQQALRISLSYGNSASKEAISALSGRIAKVVEAAKKEAGAKD